LKNHLKPGAQKKKIKPEHAVPKKRNMIRRQKRPAKVGRTAEKDQKRG